MKNNQHNGVELQDSGELLILVLTLVLETGCCSVTQSYPNLCDPMDYAMPGSPHHLLQLAQTHVH